MEKRANEFLKLSGELYDINKAKWIKMFDGFDEDVYNDTIIKVYESILKGADIDGDLLGYWYKAFKNNLRKKHTRKELDSCLIPIDKVDENDINLYFSTISSILYQVYQKFDRKTFEVFRMYLLCNMSYQQIDDVVNTDSKEKISRIRKWLMVNGKKDFR